VAGVNMDVNAIFQIAGLGIVVAMLHTVLKQAGKEEWAHWATLIGIILVLFMVISKLDELFNEIQRVFLFQ
jgi:stage III sporulation protein AC